MDKDIFNVVDFIALTQVVSISLLIVGIVVLIGFLIPKNSILPKYLYWILHPNAISFWRGVIGVFAIYFYANTQNFESQILAIYLYVFSAILDKTDGDVARKCNLTTKLGESFDPFFDKITYFAGLYYFMVLGYLDLKIFLLFLSLDMFSQFMRLFIRKRGGNVAAVSWGKIKTTFVFILVSIIATKHTFGINIPNDIFNFIFLISLGLAYMSIYGKLPRFWRKKFLKITIPFLFILLWILF